MNQIGWFPSSCGRTVAAMHMYHIHLPCIPTRESTHESCMQCDMYTITLMNTVDYASTAPFRTLQHVHGLVYVRTIPVPYTGVQVCIAYSDVGYSNNIYCLFFYFFIFLIFLHEPQSLTMHYIRDERGDCSDQATKYHYQTHPFLVNFYRI